MLEINKKINLTYEAFAVLGGLADSKKFDQKIAELIESYAFSQTQQAEFFDPIKTICDHVATQMASDEKEINLYFGKMKNSGISFAEMLFMLTNLLSRLPNHTPDDASYAETLFFLYLMGRIDISPTKPLSLAEMVGCLQSTDMSDEHKWSMIELFSNFSYHKRLTEKLVATAQGLISQKIDGALGLVGNCVSRFTSGETFIHKGEISISLKEKHIIVPAVIAFQSAAVLDTPEEIAKKIGDRLVPHAPIVYYGVLLDIIYDKKRETAVYSLDNLFIQLKALTDMTRLRILKELTGGPMKGFEIAKTIGITPATVSHHMNELLLRKLVSMEKQGTSVIYSLNVGMFEQLNKIISNIFERK